ncbi:MAG: PAS domain S-box protein [Anaerolineae bacterium]|nr:PAS domain S-box protein [Anaerolineae bacterium]
MPSGETANSSPAHHAARAADGGDVLESITPAGTLDRWTDRASRLLHVPMACISVIETSGAVIQSGVGLVEIASETGLVSSFHLFINRVVAQGQPVLLSDTRPDSSIAASPEPRMAAYAGVPLLATQGDRLGVLSVADHQPRAWTADDLALLQDLAASISAHLERQTLMGALQAAQQETEAARHALKRSETRFAKTFSLSPLILTITSAADGRLIDVNATFERLTGYTREEALGRTPVELDLWLNPVDREQGLQALRNNQSISNVEAEFRMRNGQVMTALCSAEVIEIDGQPCVLTVLNDISERKRAEDILQRYQLLSERARDIVLFVRRDGHIIEANQAAIEAYGYDRDTLLSLSIYDLRAPVTSVEIEAQMARADGSGILFETVHRRRDGSTFPVEVSSIGADMGGERVLLSILRDITDRKRLERQKDEFIAVASHELKTPLTSAKVFAQLLRKRLNRLQDEPAGRYLDKTEQQIDKLTELVNDLLDVSRIEAGRLELQAQAFSLVDCVHQIVADIQPTADAHGIVIEGDLATPVVGDQDRIGQVILNLLTNAVKYSPGADTVIVRLEDTPDQVIVSVQDFGIGIPPSDQAKIFDRFFRVDGTRERTYPGLGLGLYISSEIIRRHGGQLWVISEPGRGSTFTFSLPKHLAATPSSLP